MPHLDSAPAVPGARGPVEAPKKVPDVFLKAQKQRETGRTIVETPSCPQAMKRGSVPWSFSDFTVLRLLGEGQMSSVVHCTCTKSSLPVAIKMYHKDRMNSLNVKQVAREIEIHASLQHRSIIQLYAAFEDRDGIYLVEEYASKGDLFGELARKGGYMQEGYVVKNVLLPFLAALGYLHGQGVLHRDIKPENILLGEDGQIRIGDFGLAINVVRERPVSRVGTLDYMPPEIVRLPQPNQQTAQKASPEGPPSYGLAVDVWCVGILAYELLIGGPPFETDTREETFMRILKFQPHLPSHLSEQAKDFVSQCLRKEPAQRPTVMQLLRHPWIKTYQPGAQYKASPDGRFSQLLSPQSSPRGGSFISSTAKLPGVSSQEAQFSVLPSAASAPCLAPGGRPMFSPLAGRLGIKPSKPLGVSPLSPGSSELTERCPRVNSFVGLRAPQSVSPRPGQGPAGLAPMHGASRLALRPDGLPHAGLAASSGAGKDGVWIEIDVKEEGEQHQQVEEAPAAALQPGGGGEGAGAKVAVSGPAAASSKVFIHADAGLLASEAPPPINLSRLYDLNSLSQSAGLIPASRSQPLEALQGGWLAGAEGTLHAGKMPLADQGASALTPGSPGASCFAGLVSRLSGNGKTQQLQAGGSLSQSATEDEEGLQPGQDKLFNQATAPALAQALAPAPGEVSRSKLGSKSFLSRLGQKLGKSFTGNNNSNKRCSSIDLQPSVALSKLAPKRGASAE